MKLVGFDPIHLNKTMRFLESCPQGSGVKRRLNMFGTCQGRSYFRITVYVRDDGWIMVI